MLILLPLVSSTADRRRPGLPDRRRQASRILSGALILVILVGLLPAGGSPSAAAVPTNDRFGFVFVNGAGYNIPDSRYRQAVDAGAGWTRWPFYWQDIERSNGVYDYSAQDAVVNRDRQFGLEINGILMGNPAWTNGALQAQAGYQPRVEGKRRPGVRSADL